MTKHDFLRYNDEPDNLPNLYLEKIKEIVKELKEQYDRCMKEKGRLCVCVYISMDFSF